MTEPIISTNPPPIPTPEPKAPSPLPIIILAILVVFALAGMGFLYWQNQQLQNQLTTINTNQSDQEQTIRTAVIPTQTPTVVIDQTADWSTFSNSTYPFTFKYPSSWTQTKLLNNTYQFAAANNNPSLQISIFPIGQIKSGGEQVNLLGNIVGYKNTNEVPAGVFHTTIHFVIKNKDYNFDLEHGSMSNENANQLYDQILSTLKVLPTINTTKAPNTSEATENLGQITMTYTYSLPNGWSTLNPTSNAYTIGYDPAMWSQAICIPSAPNNCQLLLKDHELNSFVVFADDYNQGSIQQAIKDRFSSATDFITISLNGHQGLKATVPGVNGDNDHFIFAVPVSNHLYFINTNIVQTTGKSNTNLNMDYLTKMLNALKL